MDQDRQIRFLIAPFFLYASLTWWAYLDPELSHVLLTLKPGDLKDLLSIAAAAGAATIPVGYSIGGLGIALLKSIFYTRSRLRGHRQTYEASLSDDAFQVILR